MQALVWPLFRGSHPSHVAHTDSGASDSQLALSAINGHHCKVQQLRTCARDLSCQFFARAMVSN